MSLGILEPLLQRFDILLFLMLRVLGLFMTAPVLSNRVVPVQLRVAVSFAVAMIVSPLFQAVAPAASLAQLVPLAAQELLVGVTVGFVASLMFSVVQFAGQLLDITMGLSIMNVLDPLTNLQMPVIGNLLYMTAILIFFGLDGHHTLIRAIMDSYVLVPLGTAIFHAAAAQSVVAMGSKLFLIGFKVASPVLAALFVATLALGILNRAVPQMNVFVIGMPVQFTVGIVLLIIAMPLYISFLRLLFDDTFASILTVLRLLKG